MQSGLLLKLTLLLVASLTIMSGATISPALPSIEVAFRETANVEFLTRLVLTLPGLFVALASPLVGRLADRIGRKKLLIAAIALYAGAGSSGLYAGSLTGVLVGRALLGVAVAGVMTLGTALVGDYFSGTERDRYMGLQQAFTGFGGLAFLTAGGYLADLGWRYPFAIYASAALLLPLAAMALREPDCAQHGERDTRAMPAASWFRPIAALCLMVFLFSAIFYLIPAQLPFYMKTLGIRAPSDAGLAIALVTVFSTMASLSFARVRRHASPPAIFIVGIPIMATGLGIAGIGASLGLIMVGMALIGLGSGFIVPNLLSLAMTLAPETARGRVSGAITACLFLGQFASPFASQPLISAWGYQPTFLAGAAMLLLTLIPGTLAAMQHKK